jgi:hypothetical protein
MMFGIFTTIFGKEFIIASIILIFGEIISVILFKIFNVSDLKDYFENDFKKDEELLKMPKAKTRSEKRK